MNTEARKTELRAEFATRAQAWLQGRPDRRLVWPADRPDLIAAVGVPCGDCLEVVRDPEDVRHPVRHAAAARGGHWSAAITTSCRRSTVGAPGTRSRRAAAPPVVPLPRGPVAPPPEGPARRSTPPAAALQVAFSAGG